MATLNPLQLLQLIRSGNPAQLAQQIINQNYPNDPNMQHLLQMAQQGDTQGINQFAQQFFSSQGKDFNTELQSFLNMVKGGRA